MTKRYLSATFAAAMLVCGCLCNSVAFADETSPDAQNQDKSLNTEKTEKGCKSKKCNLRKKQEEKKQFAADKMEVKKDAVEATVQPEQGGAATTGQ